MKRLIHFAVVAAVAAGTYSSSATTISSETLLPVDDDTAHIISFHPDFSSLIHGATRPTLVYSKDYEFAHEGPVYLRKRNQLVFTSNRLSRSDGSQHVEISSLNLDTKTVTVLNPAPAIVMANGACKVDENTIAFCTQGLGSVNATMEELDLSTMTTTTVVRKWHNLSFNSLNDVVMVHRDERSGEQGYFFTDPPYGFAQGFRSGAQELPPRIWYYRRTTVGKAVNVDLLAPVSEDFTKPNGLCLSPDRKILYVSDSAYDKGDGAKDVNLPRSVYAFDIVHPGGIVSMIGRPFLQNKRLFASVDVGIPDGIKADVMGNVYVGAGDGVHVFNQNGVEMGRILTPSGKSVPNLVFVDRTLYMLAGTEIYSINLVHAGAERY